MIKPKYYKTAIIVLIVLALYIAGLNYKNFARIQKESKALAAFKTGSTEKDYVLCSDMVKKLTEYGEVSITRIDNKDMNQLSSIQIEFNGKKERARDILNEISRLPGIKSIKNINITGEMDDSKITAEIFYLSNIICK